MFSAKLAVSTVHTRKGGLPGAEVSSATRCTHGMPPITRLTGVVQRCFDFRREQVFRLAHLAKHTALALPAPCERSGDP